MESGISKQLVDKMYEKRKAAALELEKQIRECHQQGDHRRIGQIIDQLVDMFNNPTNPLHVRNGGLIGLAGTAIALGVDIAPYMEKFTEPLLVCFADPENRVRYFSAECLYNIAKVSKGEILVYFNPIFDALSKLAADSELSVKNGAELLDRLLKDIVAETASVYIPHYPETEKARKALDEGNDMNILVPHPDDVASGADINGARKAFSLARFIPLLSERIYVLSPFTRSYLVSWITVLDSVPELELITYLPEFLDGLLKYLSDPTEDVRIATENLLADFLREIRDVTTVQRQYEEQFKTKREAAEQARRTDTEKPQEITISGSDRGGPFLDGDDGIFDDSSLASPDEKQPDHAGRDVGHWVPGQGVKIDYPAIVEILLQQLDDQHDVIQQSTALRWLTEFLTIVQDVMVPFTPHLISVVLPNLSHHALLNVIQSLPPPLTLQFAKGQTNRRDRSRDLTSPETASPPEAATVGERPPTASSQRTRTNALQSGVALAAEAAQPAVQTSRPASPISAISVPQVQTSPEASLLQEKSDRFDYQATVNALTIQFLSEHEDTRVAALKWLIMLHQKAPKKILAIDDGTFPALLKTLSDPSEEVVKSDLQLIAQISSSSDESYFKAFMVNLLDLFSTDRGLLEARGSLIIRQLCLNLNTERIYRTFAEILEKKSGMVQKLNMILITSPELAEFRRRLKSLETRVSRRSSLFTTLYRSWCHNAVAAFSLHASNLLYIFADLEITVPLLVQIDKLVQLIESPLLEPEKHPHLFKCLYGLLMLLPQSSAFVSLRNRLSAVNSAGFLHIAPKSTVASISSTRSKLGREDIKWQELLSHFRMVQGRHEKARRQALGTDTTPFAGFTVNDKPTTNGPTTSTPAAPSSLRPQIRRKVTGGEGPARPPSRSSAVLSPLNPKARAQSGLLASNLAHPPTSPTFPAQTQPSSHRGR
ncbi:ARM repeat-containing protein [Fomitopsis serialis]|uniref:ARM repeat-containing protein n=1 Tax=Fomitopsis serialis TaxID=139415 RepID=UPI0020085F46|nr:ARM repeat-containing protein [Neoantrodia serialis]KAH9938004.1 ARM repeat-containing protein [Neoantrodia serialis]